MPIELTVHHPPAVREKDSARRRPPLPLRWRTGLKVDRDKTLEIGQAGTR